LELPETCGLRRPPRPSREDSGDEKHGISSEIINKYGEYIIIFWGFHGNTYYIYIYVTNKIII
jgi:hypothetical protein